uniref:Nematode Specific Peptide family, group B n=1 Tax=Caenorhabditis japonica TaxID=281687 RepID=A0A8R1DTB6_CAEJA
MFVKCFAAVVLCAMIIGSHQQVVVPAYSAAYSAGYVPSAYAYPSVYSPYVAAAAYPSVWAWGSNKNKEDAPRAFARPSALLNSQKTNA